VVWKFVSLFSFFSTRKRVFLKYKYLFSLLQTKYRTKIKNKNLFINRLPTFTKRFFFFWKPKVIWFLKKVCSVRPFSFRFDFSVLNRTDSITTGSNYGTQSIPNKISLTLPLLLLFLVRRFPWNKLKPLLLHKLEIVTKEFHEKSPMSSSAARPNVENTTFEELFQRLLDMLQQFHGFVCLF